MSSISGDFTNNVPQVGGPSSSVARQQPVPSAVDTSMPRLSAGQIQQHYAFYNQVSNDAGRLKAPIAPREALTAVFGKYPVQPA
jgi:hypothetical protein